MYQFKAKYSEMKYYTLCLRNISKDFSINNMEKRKKKTGLKGTGKVFLSIIMLLILIRF